MKGRHTLKRHTNKHSFYEYRSSNGTRKMKGGKSKMVNHVIKRLLEVMNVIKLYHWRTRSYATHEATDDLFTEFIGKMDQYVEVLLGKTDVKLNLGDFKRLHLDNITNNRKMESFVKRVIDEMYGIHKKMNEGMDGGLLGIRDEIVGELNKFLFLLRMR